MLDSDASFFLVPEFQSSRGARRSRSAPSSDFRHDAAQGTDLCLSPLSDAGTRGVAALAAFGFPSANFVPEEARITTDALQQSGHMDPFTLPVATDALTFTGESQLDDITDAASDSLFIESAEMAPPVDAEAAPALPETRAITPRRPMRFTFAREPVEPGRIALPTPNLFDGVFDTNTLAGPDIDPRLQRSRARALARLAAHEATLPPEARNLWHDDGCEADIAPLAAETISHTTDATLSASHAEAAPEIATTVATGPVTPRRAVRQIAVTRRTPRPRPEAAAPHDPLQDQLHQIRDALYAPLPAAADTAEEAQVPAKAPAQTPVFARLVALIMALAVMRTFLALQRAVARPRSAPKAPAFIATLRGLFTGPMRMPARAVAITALVLVLAQTVPRDVM